MALLEGPVRSDVVLWFARLFGRCTKGALRVTALLKFPASEREASVGKGIMLDAGGVVKGERDSERAKQKTCCKEG